MAQSGTKWSVNEDLQLMNEYQDDISIIKIANIHQRSVGAIRSRIKQKFTMKVPVLKKISIQTEIKDLLIIIIQKPI